MVALAITKITFYSKKNCPQCSTAARLLAARGVTGAEGRGINASPKGLPDGPTVNLIKVDEDSEALAVLKARGFASVPVIDYELGDGRTGTIVGADVDAIEKLAKERHGE